jgi:hypothetical protein
VTAVRATRLSDWERLPPNPDLDDDFGYSLRELEFIQTGPTGEIVVLPTEEELIEHEAFIVADEAAISDLQDWR